MRKRDLISTFKRRRRSQEVKKKTKKREKHRTAFLLLLFLFYRFIALLLSLSHIINDDKTNDNNIQMTTTDGMKTMMMNLITTAKMKGRSKKEAILMILCIILAFVFLVPLSVLAIIAGPLALMCVKRSKLRPHEEESKKEEEETKKSGFTITKKEEIDNDEKETLTNKTTVPIKVEEKVALTGSAALMANMRRSAANTANTGEEKRQKEEKKSGTISKEEKEETRDNKSGQQTIWYVLHGGEAAQQVARDVKEAMEEEFLEKRGMKASDVRVTTASMEDFKKTLELHRIGEDNNKKDEISRKRRRAIFVVETVENAQPAEEAGSCIRYFNKLRKALKSSEGGDKATKLPFDENDAFEYTVMGLGDTNLLLDRQTTTAKDCNQAAQTLDNALAALGARRLCERGLANDAVGLEEGVLPWLKEKLLPSAFKAIEEEKVQAERDKPIEVVFAYGSQTGNAAEICKNLAAEATEKYKKDKTMRVECFACNELDAETSLKPGTVILFCVSSTGDGDAPDNCDMFLTRLKRRVKKTTASDPVLAGTQYAVLGLGDQNYSAFMAVPRMFSTTMEKGGATVYKKRLEADDTLGLYEQVDAWVDTLWEDLDKAIARAKSARENPKGFLTSSSTNNGSKSDTTTTVTTTTAKEAILPSSYKGIPALQPARVKISFTNNGPTEKSTSSVELGKDALATRETPFFAKIAAKKILTNASSDRRVVHLEFDCEEQKRFGGKLRAGRFARGVTEKRHCVSV